MMDYYQELAVEKRQNQIEYNREINRLEAIAIDDLNNLKEIEIINFNVDIKNQLIEAIINKAKPLELIGLVTKLK